MRGSEKKFKGPPVPSEYPAVTACFHVIPDLDFEMRQTEKRTGPRVLLLDRQADETPAALECLKAVGVDGMRLEHAIEALGMFEQIAPDVVVLRATEPEMDRYAVCRSIQNVNRRIQAWVLVAVDPRDSGAIQRAFDAGANDFVPEPIDWDALGRRVSFLWRDRRRLRSIEAGVERYRQLVNSLPDTLVRVDSDSVILDVEGSEQSDLARLVRNGVGKSLPECLFGDPSGAQATALAIALRKRASQTLNHDLQLESRTCACEVTLVPTDRDDWVAILRDVTERRRREDQMRQLACQDGLTGLQSRSAFKEHLSVALARARRDGRVLALLLLDLNRFQRINETFGTGVGDQLLRLVADRIVHCTRRGDSKARLAESHHALARIGPDQFAVLLDPIDHARDSSKVARRLLDALARPFILGDAEVFMTASIGIALFPGDADSVDALLSSAHKAMLDGKESERSTFRFAAPATQAQAASDLNLEMALRKALDNGELFLVYQPQVEVHTGKVVGVEALLRWDHPERGLVSPVEFIPIAERTGLIVPIGEWVLGVACLQCKIWQKAGLPPIRMAVNLSALQFQQRNLVELVRRTLAKTSLDPTLLDLEITEGTAMKKAELSIQILKNLKEIGVQISIDDFGTGYSSLSYLKHFPLDVLKIDRSFIKDVAASSDSVAIVRAIIAMARSLNLSLVAEGVETEPQLNFLRSNGCEIIQGYYFSPPVPALEMTKLLETARLKGASFDLDGGRHDDSRSG